MDLTLILTEDCNLRCTYCYQRMFVVKADGFPNMDGDLYTPMEYYLASVIDYLNWVHGDRQLDRAAIFGRPREQYTPPKTRDKPKE